MACKVKGRPGKLPGSGFGMRPLSELMDEASRAQSMLHDLTGRIERHKPIAS